MFEDQLLPVAEAVCPDPGHAPERAALAVSQLLGLALTRCVLRLPAVTAQPGEDILAWLAPTVQRYLTAARP